jgi:hypothetical protein
VSPRKAKVKEKTLSLETPEGQTPSVEVSAAPAPIVPVSATPVFAAPAPAMPQDNEVLSQLKRISDHLGFLEKKIDAIAESMKNQRPRESRPFLKPGGNYRNYDRPGFNKRPGYNNDYRGNSGGHGSHSRGPYQSMSHGSHGSGPFHQKFSHHAKPPMSRQGSSNQPPAAYASDPT